MNSGEGEPLPTEPEGPIVLQWCDGVLTTQAECTERETTVTTIEQPTLPATGTAEGGIAAVGSLLIFLGLGMALAARR